MKNIQITFLLFISSGILNAQTVRFEISSLPPNHPSNAAIYLAGSFNGWNPSDESCRFRKDEKGQYYFEKQLSPGNYEYKITRGGWDKVECQRSGAGIANRTLKLEGPQTVKLQIEEWQDRFPAKPRESTRSKNVKIIDTAFLIPQLRRTRRVWIYLPENYSSSKDHYPVLYMHDGQNVFDDATSFSGEWGVDEFLDTTSLRKAIVVGIDHAGNKRINEYCPYDMEKFGKGEGDAYVDFLVKTLKPFIDKNYRTKTDKEDTWVAGSSMGGLISMYAILKYPKTFGGAGVFSPAFWVGPRIFNDIKKMGSDVKGSVYFYGGKLEGETMVPDMLKAFQEMAKVSKARMETVIRDEGRHNEPTWRKEFPLFYKWIITN
jgi:alpha-glucosidase